MANFVGHWKVKGSQNFAEFLAANGAAAEKIAAAQSIEESSTTEFYYDGQVIGRKIFKPDGTLFVDKSIKVGEEKDDISLINGSQVKESVTIVSDSKVIHEERGDNHYAKATAELVDGEIHQTIEGNGASCTRVFVRI